MRKRPLPHGRGWFEGYHRRGRSCMNRRDFLKAAAIAAGPAAMTARAANDKVNIGWIGVGTRGYASLDWMHTAAPNDVQITAICDTYQGYIARAKDRMA